MNEGDLSECSGQLMAKFPKWNPTEAVQRAYSELMRPYSKAVVLAAISDLWSQSDKAWAEPTPAALRKCIGLAVSVGPPKSDEQREYEARFYGMSRRDQLAELHRAYATALERNCFDAPHERDAMIDREGQARRTLAHVDALHRDDPAWPPTACDPEHCGFAGLTTRHGRLCRQIACPQVESPPESRQ